MLKTIIKFSAVIFTLLLIASCSDDEVPGTMNPGGMTGDFVVYEGAKITFEKANGADATLEANQDRITDNVWITRGNTGGEIFNAKTESRSTKGSSPAGTEWAQGTTANIANLNFATFRTTVKPQDAVGKNLVLHLIAEDEYLDIKFTAWSSGKDGGFAYERSTK